MFINSTVQYSANVTSINSYPEQVSLW